MSATDNTLTDGVDIIKKLESILNENKIKLDPQLQNKIEQFKQRTRDRANEKKLKTAPLNVPKRKLLKAKSVGNVPSAADDDAKAPHASSASDPFTTTLTSVVIKINETLKPINLSNVHRLFSEEKEFNESTIFHIDPDIFCERAKKYHIEPSQAKRILSQLQSPPLQDATQLQQVQSLPTYSILITKDPLDTKSARLKVRPGIMKAKSLNALQGLDDEKKPLWTKEQWLKDKNKLDGIMLGKKARDKPRFVRTKSMNALQDRDDVVSLKKDVKNKDKVKVQDDDQKEAEVPTKNVLSETDILSVYISYFNDIHEEKRKADTRRKKLKSGLLEADTMKLLSDCSEDLERQMLMKDKLELCEFLCNFRQSKDEKEAICIDNKRELLSEVLQSMMQHKWNNEQLLKQCIRTIKCNLFRALVEPDPFDEDPVDPSWDHINLIYELMYHVVSNSNTDKDVMRSYLEGGFLRNLVYLFRSPDDREPEYVKIIVHQIYGRFMKLRQTIRRYLSEFCYSYLYLSTFQDAFSFQGIAQILEIFGALFQGLNVPVKQGYHDIIRNVIVPLHKSFHLDEFHAELVFCCTAFIAKEPEVTCVLLGGMLKFWPKQSQMKEQLFMLEMVELLKACIDHPDIDHSDTTFVAITIAVLNQLIKCMGSPHREVSQQAFMSFNDETIKRIVVDLDREEILLDLRKVLKANCDHWSEDVREITAEQLKILDAREKHTDIGPPIGLIEDVSIATDDEFNSDNEIRDV